MKLNSPTRSSAAAALVLGSIGAALAAPAVVADTAPPVIKVSAPTANQVFGDHLLLKASARDKDGLGKISFLVDDKPIKNFTTGLRNGVPVVLDWKRARELKPGVHTIKVVALDKAGSNPATKKANSASVDVKVRRVDVAKLPRARTTVAVALSGTGLTRTVRGKITALAPQFSQKAFPLAGQVRVTWWIWSNGRFKIRHKDSADASVPYRLKQRLAGKGRWRVRVNYDGQPPYRASSSKTIAFTVR